MKNTQPTPADRQKQNFGPSPQPANRRPEFPWRTEGVPQRRGEDSKDDKGDRPTRNRWLRATVALALFYALAFALLTWEDVAGGPTTVPYTVFTEQVDARNVAEVYTKGDTIQGTLREARPVPGQEEGTYEEFQTERPTFAQDDLLAELEATGATVRATPVNQNRGPLYNLLISVAPVLLLVAFYYWLFRRASGQKRETLDEPEIYAAARISRPADEQPMVTALA